MSGKIVIGTGRQPNREGFALVSTLLVVLVLSVLAVGIAWLATSEKKVSFAEAVHVSSVMSADAGGDAAINFLRMAPVAPPIQDFTDNSVITVGTTTVLNSQTYAYEAFFVGKSLKPGWGLEFLDYNYRVDSYGTASRNGQSQIRLIASRLFKEGY